MPNSSNELDGVSNNDLLKPKWEPTKSDDQKLEKISITSSTDGIERSGKDDKLNIKSLKTESLITVNSHSKHSPPSVPITCLRKHIVGNNLGTGAIMPDMGPNKPFPKLT
jgi:hypothetical protein